jgi:hypothetical protein
VAKKDRSWMDEVARPKIGAGHLEGMIRQGHKEIAQILPAFNNGQHIVEEPGIFGNLTPGEVADGKEKDLELDRNQEPVKRKEHEGREM